MDEFKDFITWIVGCVVVVALCVTIACAWHAKGDVWWKWLDSGRYLPHLKRN